MGEQDSRLLFAPSTKQFERKKRSNIIFPFIRNEVRDEHPSHGKAKLNFLNKKMHDLYEGLK